MKKTFTPDLTHDDEGCMISFATCCHNCKILWVRWILTNRFTEPGEQDAEWNRIWLDDLISLYDHCQDANLKQTLKNRIEMMIEASDG